MVQSFDEFLKQSNAEQDEKQRLYDESKVDYFKVGKGNTKEFILLSRISGGLYPQGEYNSETDCTVILQYNLYKPGGYTLDDGSGSKYLNLPFLDDALGHESEVDNPFVNPVELLGLSNKKGPKYLLWVLEVENGVVGPEPMLYTISANSVIEALAGQEATFTQIPTIGTVVGMRFKIFNSKDGKEYTLNPVNPTELMDVSDIELKPLLDYVGYQAVDAQIKVLNSVSQSFSDFHKIPDNKWAFTADGRIKEEFLPDVDTATNFAL